jgi:hypothetical protein
MLEKDDVIDCIVYILIKYKYELSNIGEFLLYLKFLQNKGDNLVIWPSKIEITIRDLESVYHYITSYE